MVSQELFSRLVAIFTSSDVVCRCLFETVLFLEAHPSAAIDVVLSPQEYLQFSNQLHVLSYATAIEQDIAKVQLSISKGTHFVRCVTEGFVPQGCSSSYFRSNEVIFNGIRAWLIKMMMFHFNKSIQKHDDFYTNALMIAFNKFFLNTDDNMSLLPFLAKYLQHKRAIFGEYHVETLVQMFENAKVMHKLQRYQEAVVLYHQCLRVKDVISGCEDTTVLSIKNELAVTLLKFFSIDAAHALLEVCVSSRRFLLGNDHIDTLNSEFHLSLVLCTKNQFEAALSLIESCLQRRTLILGLDHPVTLQTLSCKAQIAFKHMSNSKISAAQHSIKQMEINNLFTICLEKQEIILGKVHDDTILTRTNFALACSVFGDLRRARALFSESLDSIQLCSGPSHPTKFGMMRCSASVAMSAGEIHVAERLYTDCLASLRTSFGKQHPTTLMTIEDLGHVYASMQRFEDALSLFKECSDTWTQIGHPSRSFAIDLYQAATFRIQGNLLQAHSVAYESLLQCHRHFGPSHRATMELEVELGDILYAQSRWPQTKALLKKILEKKLSVDGHDNIHVIRLMAKLSNVYEKLQKYAKSRNLRIFVYNYFVEALGGYHPDTVDIMSKLARCMFLSNDLDNCEHMALAFLDRCHSLKLQNMEEQQQLRSIVDAVRRRRTRIGTFDKESGDDLLMAMELSLSMI
jgi:tetratricopeptide (TPR) repeat protein